MSHFYGTLQGDRSQATRCGTQRSGITTIAAGWHGAIRVEVFKADDPFELGNVEDRFRITLIPWKDSGGAPRVLAEGHLDSASTEHVLCDK